MKSNPEQEKYIYKTKREHEISNNQWEDKKINVKRLFQIQKKRQNVYQKK